MSAKKYLLLWINILGGAAVLGSYAYGLLTYPNAGDILWGGVPAGIRPFYTTGMALGAIGYFAFTYFIVFRLNPGETRVGRRFGFGVFTALYAAFLIPSALWMPLTLLAVNQSSIVFLWMAKIILAVVGLASLGLLLSLYNLKVRQPSWAYWTAAVGCAGFCIQTVVLDAIVWVMYFNV